MRCGTFRPVIGTDFVDDRMSRGGSWVAARPTLRFILLVSLISRVSVQSPCRYHKVRFFERIKLERRIHKLQRALKQCNNDEETSQELSRARDDLEYVLHFPKGEKYVSLLKNAEDAEAQAQLERERVRLRAMVKLQLLDDAIVNELNEGEMRESHGEDALGGTTVGGFAQELKEDDFFANSSGEERDTSDEDDNHGDAIDGDAIDGDAIDGDASDGDASDGDASDGDTHGEELVGFARADSDSDVEICLDHTPDTKDTIDTIESSDEEVNGRIGVEERDGAFREQPPPPRRSIPKTKRELRGEKGGHRDPAKKGKRDSMGKKSNISAKPSKQGQPLRTRAEGGRKRRPKKK